VDETLLKDAIAVLRALTTNPHLSLGDLVYTVRERELEGWEGPAVKSWSDAVVAATDVLKRATEAGL
jgi:hypothetical protein